MPLPKKSKRKLFLVESPAKAKTISEYLGGDFVVEASYGHVLDLPEKRLGIHIERNFEPEFEAIKNKSKVINRIKGRANGIEEIYLAGDSDREGEAICHELKEILSGQNRKFYRVRFREITKTAILSSLEKAESINSSLVQSQLARRILDRLVGYMISPILWKKIQGGLSAGRVQSVVLSWICKKEAEISKFIPEEYYSIHALVETDNGLKLGMQLKHISGVNAEIKSEKEVADLLDDFGVLPDGKSSSKSKGVVLKIQDVKRRTKSKKAPSPYNTASLQQDAFRFLQFSPRKTMKIAQELYEGLSLGKKGKSGLITYMRTDSRTVSSEAAKNRSKFIGNSLGEKYVSDQKVKNHSEKSAHEAIRPSDVWNTPDSVAEHLTKDQHKLYKLIWERFVASGMNPHLSENLFIRADYKNYSFRFDANKTLFEGYTRIFAYDKIRDFPDYDKIRVQKGDSLKFLEIHTEKKEAQGPVRYTESALVRKMEKTGIGRPSTYAATLEVLRKRKYVESKNKYIFPTELGVVVDSEMRHYFKEFTEENFTAQMEKNLDLIERGELNSIELLRDFYQPFSELVSEAKKNIRKKIPDLVEQEKSRNEPGCPVCGKGRIEKKLTRKGKLFYSCSRYPQCEFVSYEPPV